MFRWYEYWIKGIDNGVMDEPAVTVHVEGSRQYVTGAQWPPKAVEHRPLYLRPRHKLSFEPEPMGAEHAVPDGFYQAPLTVTDKVEILSWSTEPFTEPTEMIGQGAAHLFAEIDQPDTNFILRVWDEAPGGKRQLVTTAYLKASHRELDEERTTEGDPYHPHTRAVPVEPGKIEEYVLRVYPFAATFLPGHKLVVELSNDEPLADAHNALLPPDAFHLPVGRPVTHKIYRDAAHPRGSCCPSPRPGRWRRRSGPSRTAKPKGACRCPVARWVKGICERTSRDHHRLRPRGALHARPRRPRRRHRRRLLRHGARLGLRTHGGGRDGGRGRRHVPQGRQDGRRPGQTHRGGRARPG
ncbi:hypothetical protein SHKM778_50970 [Streptomyces sp. KM77-8]|uniref:Xaa-Pro dipeptidyl-peptidase C-terminal domain-containing protein n=1 Tax=Streptomyces haneummycinicus TaxID=3074435 RepID=A0AAT9HMX9_9ACTN